MKQTSISFLAILFLLGAHTIAIAQRNRLVSKLNMDVGENPGCEFRFINGGLMFLDEGDTWMNIDGRNVRLGLVKETSPKGRLRRGSRISKRYVAGDITVDVVEVITEFSSISRFSATFTVRKGNRTEVVRATGMCGD